MKQTCGIYKITSPNGKIYIGKSINIEKRWNAYKLYNCKGQRQLYNSLKKYKYENHIFEIIHICEKEKLDDAESYYIKLFDCLNSGLNLLYKGVCGLVLKQQREKIKEKRLILNNKQKIYYQNKKNDYIKSQSLINNTIIQKIESPLEQIVKTMNGKLSIA